MTQAVDHRLPARRRRRTVRAIPGLLMAVVSAAVALVGLVWALDLTRRRRKSGAPSLTRELEHANRDLERVSERLSRALAVTGVGLWEVNLETGEAWASTELAAMMGDEPEVWQSQHTFVDRLHPDDRAAALDTDLRGTETTEKTFRLRHRDGSYRLIASRAQLAEFDGTPYLVGGHVDVTERASRARELEMLNLELTRSNQSLREFTHVASHDLRSPIRGIGSLIGFIREDAEHLDEHIEVNLDRIEDRVVRMNALIDDLLAYARATESDERRSSFDVGATVEDVIGAIAVPHGMEVVHQGVVGELMLERVAFSTCVRNLVDNAVKHHDNPEAGSVNVTLEQIGSWLTCHIADDGPGIPEEYADTVFEPFRRLDTEAASPGSGVGLAVVRRVCERHGATVECAPAPERGSIFTLEWPLSR